MKIRRYKYARKVLSFYKNNFGLRQPYQIIVDGTFCQAALNGKIQLKEQLTKYLGGEVQLVTTHCILKELESLGSRLKGAYFIAQNCQLRNCAHANRFVRKKIPASASKCIRNMIGKENESHYCIASQDKELQTVLRKIPGVPLLHIVRNTVVLEGPSDTTQNEVDKINDSKVAPTSYQQEVIDALNKEEPQDLLKKKTRKRPKGPNPLSVKKKRPTVPVQSRSVARGVVSSSKRRRARLERKKAIEALANSLQLKISKE